MMRPSHVLRFDTLIVIYIVINCIGTVNSLFVRIDIKLTNL